MLAAKRRLEQVVCDIAIFTIMNFSYDAISESIGEKRPALLSI
jgi:hypothetical protein